MGKFMYRRRRRLAAKRFVRLQRKYKKKRRTTVAKVNKKVNKLIRSTKTFVDTNFSNNISTIGSFYDVGLTSLVNGTGEGQRSGDKITLTSLQIKFRLSVLNGSAINADAFNNVRLILVQFPQPVLTGNPVVTLDILQYNDWNSMYKKRGNVKYKILMDKHYYMDNQGFGSGAASNPVWTPATTHQKLCNFKYKFPKGGLTITYTKTQSTVLSNDIALFMISDSSIQGHPTVNGYVRLNFQP